MKMPKRMAITKVLCCFIAIIRAVSAPGSAISDPGEENNTYPCKGTDGHSKYVKKLKVV
jgi:hypothetical protein